MKANSTGLVPLFFLKALDGSANVAGDIAGYPPKVAQALVDGGYAEEYSEAKHKRPAEERQQALDTLMADRAGALAVANFAHFSPAELLHEKEAEIAALKAQIAGTLPSVPSHSGTREQIEERSTVIERPVVANPSAALTTNDLNAAKASGKKSAESTAPVPPS